MRDKNSWVIILREKAKAVRPTYKVIIFNVRTDEINSKETEKSIDIIKERNKGVKNLCTIKISWLGYLKFPKLRQPTGHLILEFTLPNHANVIIDKNLIIGSSLKLCQVYNRVCKIQQCFNYQNYAHNMPQCINLEACC